MALSSSTSIWELIEQHDSEDQKHFLQWQLQAREPIRSFADIRKGDHLVRKSSFMKGLISYEHHFLCIGFDDEGKPKIMHYYNTAWNASMQLIPTSLGLGSTEQLGIVQEMTLPHKDFIKSEDELQAEGSEVERVVWPEELRRYTVEEVVKHAEDRKNEKWYNIVKNNCETFVMKCLCGLEISFQVTGAIRIICETGSALIKMGRQAFQQFLSGIDDIVLAALKSTGRTVARSVLSKGIGVVLGPVVSIIVETFLTCRDIYEAKKKRDKGVVITNRKQFIKTVIDKVISGLLRAGGSIGGMILGQSVIPIPVVGAIVGAVAGVFIGHVSAKLLERSGLTERLAECIENYLQSKENEERARIFVNHCTG